MQIVKWPKAIVIPAGVIASMVVAQPAWAGAAAETMGPGGPGFAVVQLMLVAAFGALCFYITQALSLGQVAGMIKLVTVFTCIGIVISAVWSAISAVASFFQIQL